MHICLREFVHSICVQVRCLWRTEGLDPLELQFWVVANCLMWVLETKPRSFARAPCTLNLQAILPAVQPEDEDCFPCKGWMCRCITSEMAIIFRPGPAYDKYYFKNFLNTITSWDSRTSGAKNILYSWGQRWKAQILMYVSEWRPIKHYLTHCFVG